MLVQYPDTWVDSKDLQKDVAEKIFYLSRQLEAYEFTEEGLLLTLCGSIVDEVQLIADVQDLMTKLAAAFKHCSHEILESGSHVASNTVGPDEVLDESRQIYMSSPGVPIFTGDFLKVKTAIDNYIRDYALEFGCEEHLYPTTVPSKSLINSGYLGSFPQHALLVGTVHHDLESLRAIAKEPEAYHDVSKIDDLVSNHAQVLAPTVCGHCFELLAGQKIEKTQALYTATAHCHRHEGNNHSGFERLQTYTMREIIFFGSAAFVKESQEKILKDVKAMFEQWGLQWRIAVASDPFFATGNEQKKAFQTLFRLKYELQVYLPQKDQWIASASFNHHQDSLVKPYKVTGQDNELNSGCFGIGLERITYAMFSQMGVDLENWDSTVREQLVL